MVDPRVRLARLAAKFPTLQGAPGTSPFDAEDLDKWAARGGTGTGSQHAARFVLAVYNANVKRKCGPFDAVKALGSWDNDHRAAFLHGRKTPGGPNDCSTWLVDDEN
jgi:hypothetical protein